MNALRTLPLLAVALCAAGCAPRIRVKYDVPAAVHLDAVQQTYVVSTMGSPDALTVLDPLSALVRTVVAPDVARHLEERLMQAGLFAVFPGCPAPCPSADTRFEVELEGSSVSRGTMATKDTSGTATRATVQVKVRVIGRGEVMKFAETYDGNTDDGVPKAGGAVTSDEALVRQAAFHAVNAFVRDLKPSVGSVMFELFEDGPLKPGVKLAMEGDLDGAWNAFREVVQKEPNNAPALYDLAVVMTAKGELEAARDAFAAAGALDSRFADEAESAAQRVSTRDAWRAQQGKAP